MNIESQRISFYILLIILLATIGYFLTPALAAYIAVCLVGLFLMFTVPPLFWAILFASVIYGGYLVHMHVTPLI